MTIGSRAKGGRRARPASADGRGRHRGWLWPAVRGLAAAGVWAMVVMALMAGWYALDLPDLDEALAATRPPRVDILAADGTRVAAVGDLYGAPARLGELPPALPRAVLATEDRRFYRHPGVDPIGLARAMVTNVRAGALVQGGSTITQQVAKNLFLTPERTLKRKVQEVMLALWLERRFSKDQILTMYLNRVYLGAGSYGVDAAARRYFGRPARDVSLYEAAMLAGMLKAPSRYNPIADPARADRRARQVLGTMVAAGYLSEGEALRAHARAGPAAAERWPRSGRHFVDWVMEQVPDFVTAGDRDLIVVTSLDPRLQRAVEGRVEAILAGPGARVEALEAAVVVMTPDGAVRAMVGGRDHGASQFNRATQAMRQPGSAFKPIVYLAGLEAGLTPDSRLLDAPLVVDGWAPRNFKREYAGEVSVAEALAESLNTVAVRVAERAGRRRVVEAAHRLGITANLMPTPSLALGAGEVTLLELTAAYAVFAAGGTGVWPHAIVEVRDGGGQVIYRRSGSGPGQVVAEERAWTMNRLLAGVVAGGTGRGAALDRPVAGKTGTSQEFRDAWFVGYSADLVAGVWMGNDDGRPMKGVTGGGLPARLWREVMTAAHAGLPVRPLPGLDALPRPDSAPGLWRNLLATFGAGGR